MVQAGGAGRVRVEPLARAAAPDHRAQQLVLLTDLGAQPERGGGHAAMLRDRAGDVEGRLELPDAVLDIVEQRGCVGQRQPGVALDARGRRAGLREVVTDLAGRGPGRVDLGRVTVGDRVPRLDELADAAVSGGGQPGALAGDERPQGVGFRLVAVSGGQLGGEQPRPDGRVRAGEFVEAVQRARRSRAGGRVRGLVFDRQGRQVTRRPQTAARPRPGRVRRGR